jgi:hypothetical protein
MNALQHRLRNVPRLGLGIWLGLSLGLVGAAGCFDDPLTSLTENNETSGDGDGDPGDGDGDPGDGDGDPGDGDGDGDGDPGDGDGDPGDGDGDGDGDPGDGDGDPMCEPNETLCEGICVNLSTDSGNCGICGMTCPGFTLCGESMCKPEKYVFATNGSVQGNFGVEQAEFICNQAATMASLPPGLYRPWISTLIDSPNAWPLADGVWRLRGMEDTVVAYSRNQLFSGELAAPINRDEYGQPLVPNWRCNNTVEFPVWTATSESGSASGPDCMGWTSNLDASMGGIGNAAKNDKDWSTAAGCTLSCALQLRLYCFQQ